MKIFRTTWVDVDGQRHVRHHPTRRDAFLHAKATWIDMIQSRLVPRAAVKLDAIDRHEIVRQLDAAEVAREEGAHGK
jgi:hypothetical protein